jgi:hypothetical protein
VIGVVVIGVVVIGVVVIGVGVIGVVVMVNAPPRYVYRRSTTRRR